MRIVLLFILLFATQYGFAGDLNMPAIVLETNEQGNQEYSINLQILIIMTLLSFLPALMIMMTSFTRIIVVLAILRQAIGLQQTPSNQIMIGMALFLTFFTMAPVFNHVHTNAIDPFLNDQIELSEAAQLSKNAFKSFMINQTRESDLNLFMKIGDHPEVSSAHELPLTIVVPSFLTSELKTAFQMGFILFIPFLIIDLVVASVLMAMGMMMLSPLIISLPFKIMLFVLIDGWAMVFGTIASSFS